MATTQVFLTKTVVVGDNPSTASTTYGGLTVGKNFFSTTELQGTQLWAVAGTFANLLITLDTAPGSGKSWVFTVRKNGVDSGVTVTISDTATTARDTTHSVSVAAGDSLTLKAVPGSTPTASGLVTVAVEFTGTTTGESGYAGQMCSSVLSGTGTRYNGVFRIHNGWNTPGPVTTGSARSLAAAAGTITALYLLLDSTPGTGNSYVFTLYKNGVKQDGGGGTVNTQVTILAPATSGNTSFSLTVAAGDVLTWEVVPISTPLAVHVASAVRFVATTDGESQFCGCTDDAPSNAATEYNVIPSASSPVWNATESAVAILSGISTFTLSKFQMRGDSAPGPAATGNTITYSLRRNASSPAGAPSVAIFETATSGSDTTGSLSFADGDTLDLRSVPVSLPLATGTQWGFIQTMGSGAAAVETTQTFVWGPV